MIADFQFFVNFHRSGPAVIFELSRSMLVIHQKAPNQSKDLIKMVSVTLEGLWMVPDRIADFKFFVKFHSSRPAIIFSF